MLTPIRRKREYYINSGRADIRVRKVIRNREGHNIMNDKSVTTPQRHDDP